MAIPEHVKIVKQGAAAIAAWRRENPKALFDLFHAYLPLADLHEADLSGADLREANLSEAKLDGARLGLANLRKADLSGADVRDADLRGAKLEFSRLGMANLRNADLGRANLSYAFLVGADLSCACATFTDLSHTDLTAASLGGADLTGANLNEAELHQAKLCGANLRSARLTYAGLTFADLTNADLSGANLVGAKLSHADLTGADLNGATVAWSEFGDNDLAQTKGLEEVEHIDPSIIGVQTLFRSQGKIPAVFLRGCGVPEELIVQLPAIIGSMEPIQLYSCFISYSSDDDAFARRLHARLTAEKLRVWFAPEDMKGGKKVAEQIDSAIRGYDRLLLVLSEKSMESKWVRREIERAREKEEQSGHDVVFPIALAPFEKIRAWQCLDVDSGEDLAKKVREYHISDFSQWRQEDAFERAFGDLMRDLRAKAERDR